MFPEAVLKFQEELQHHPELMAQLARYPSNETEVRMAAVATYLEVALDGLYTIEELCKVLLPRLWMKRSKIILCSG